MIKFLSHLKYFKTNQLWNLYRPIVFSKIDVSLFDNKSVRNIYESNRRNNYNNYRKHFVGYEKTLLCGTLLLSIKEFFENESIKLDDDPLKDMVKQSWLYTKHKKYDLAISILHRALKFAHEQKNEMIMTRIYLEMGDVYSLSNDDNAEDLYKLVLQRLSTLHNISNSHSSYITTSIKLASVLGDKGNIRDADVGFKHCITKLKENIHKIEKELNGEINNEILNAKALYGYALNAYAHFLVKNGGDKLMNEAQSYINDAIELSNEIYGENNQSTLHLINNFAAVCIMNNYFYIAKKYLEEAIKSIEKNKEIEEIVIGMYCNLAEALYHTGNTKEAENFARKAIISSKKLDKDIHSFALNYGEELRNTMKKDYAYEKKWFFF
uniref:Tetratricopeptide repeat protein n=1 Tax=Strongyloides venezuelensis TaxID=75913 RepID=A0A0K0EY50_STRVS